MARTIRIVVAITGIGSIHFAFIESRPEIGFAGLLGLAVGNLLANLLSGGSSRERWLWPGVALACVFVLASGWVSEPEDVYVLLAVPFVFNLLFFLFFATSLLPGRMPVITRFNRLRTSRIEPVVDKHTRWVTQLWALFFAGVLVGAGLAAATGHGELASGVVSIVSPTGALAFFLGEHLYRYLKPEVFGPTSVMVTLRLIARPDTWRSYRPDA